MGNQTQSATARKNAVVQLGEETEGRILLQPTITLKRISTCHRTKMALPGQPVTKAQSRGVVGPASSHLSQQFFWAAPPQPHLPQSSNPQAPAPPHAAPNLHCKPRRHIWTSPTTWGLFFHISEAPGASTGHWPTPRPHNGPCSCKAVCWEQHRQNRLARSPLASPLSPPLLQTLRLQTNPPTLTPECVFFTLSFQSPDTGGLSPPP